MSTLGVDTPTLLPPAGEEAAPAPSARRRWRVLGRLGRNKGAVVGGGFLLFLVILAVFARWIAPDNPNVQNLFDRLQAPSWHHLLGTDELGRDELSRMVYGSRVSLIAAAGSVAIAAFGGCPFGVVAGYIGGRLDNFLSRLNDSIMSVPALLLALAMIAVIGAGLGTAILAIGLIFIPFFFRMARAATESVRNDTFIEASKALGCSTSRVILRHVLPNVLAPLVVTMTITAGTAVTAEASLSFLGVGIQPPTASWGAMLSTAASNLSADPWLVYTPGIAIALTVMAFALLGDGIASAFGTSREVMSDGIVR